MSYGQANRIRWMAIQSSVARTASHGSHAFAHMSHGDPAFVFAQERSNFVQERNIGCQVRHSGVVPSRFHTCAGSEGPLGSPSARTRARLVGRIPNDLEDSEDCRSVGGHGNQHVRLRIAQVDGIETFCPALAAPCCFEPRQTSGSRSNRAVAKASLTKISIALVGIRGRRISIPWLPAPAL